MNLLRDANVASPCYVYDVDAIAAEVKALVDALNDERHLVAYAIKANAAGTVVKAVAAAGAGADLVSGGELEVALACGIDPTRIVMSGVAKSEREIDRALNIGLHAIQAESVEELSRVAARAQTLGKIGRISLRVNPGVEIDSHAHIATGHDEAKFGIPVGDLPAAWDVIDSDDALHAVGVSTHVGSMLSTPNPYLESALTVCQVASARRAANNGKDLEFVDFGGGFGIDQGTGTVAPPAQFAAAALKLMRDQKLGDLQLVLEPGRAIVGPHGVLIARRVQVKESGERRWLMIDAGMNDLIRPALYASKHRVEPLSRAPGGTPWRVVGPVCESSDDFGEHPLGEPPEAVVIRDAGAYGFAMASEYNGRPLATEVFISGGQVAKVSPGRTEKAWVEDRLRA